MRSLVAFLSLGLSTFSYYVAAAAASLKDDGSSLSSSAKPFLTPVTPTSSASHAASTTDNEASATASSEPPITHISPGIPINATTVSNSSCHRIIEQWDDGLNGPFCEPQMYDEVWVGGTYSITWDPARFPAHSNDTISIKYINGSGDGDFARWNETVPNERGYVEVSMEDEWLNGQTRNNLSIWVDCVEPDGTRTEVSGPVVALVTRPTPSASPSENPAPASPTPHQPHRPSNKLGMEVGIPIGFAFLFALFFGLFLGMRRSGRGRGYMANRARSLRRHGTAQLTADEFRVARRRGDSFKDEPAQDVELQPRRGHTREDSVGVFTDGPTTSGLGDRSRPGSNTFRDEIARQRAGDHLPRR